jgi:hypothetical protein
MRRTGFHADQTTWKIRKSALKLLARSLQLQDNVSTLIKDVALKCWFPSDSTSSGWEHGGATH